jgi:acetyl esterase/lipase
MSVAEIEAVVALLRERAKRIPATIPELRVDFERFTGELPVLEGVEISEAGANGVPAFWVAPQRADRKHVLLYLHGGGYVIGSPRTHLPVIARLAEGAGARCLVPDYRLAPEHPFPAAVEDSVAAYRWLLEHGTDHKRIALAGDSAGGGLAIAALVAARDAGLPLPAAALCMSPWADLGCTGASMRTQASADPVITKAGALLFAQLYLGDADPREPLASPIYADLGGLPPVMIQVGGREVLLDDAVRLTQRLRADGVDVSYEQWDGMVHVWHLFAHQLSEGREALAAGCAFLRARWRAAAGR